MLENVQASDMESNYTSSAALQELQEEFALFDDIEDKYAHIIDMGKILPALDNAHKTDANKVKGCVSSVWIVHAWQENGTLLFQADSDAFIVKGLLAALIKVYSGQTPEHILSIPVEDIAISLELNHHLSKSRNNGFLAAGQRIRSTAASYMNDS